MSVVLWHIEISPYSEKIRWALDYKGVPYELRAPMPGTHRLAALRLTRGKHDRLPVMELDGTRVGDSPAIVAALEEHTPDPPLYPSDPAERDRALELEARFGEELAPRMRRAFWHYTLPDDKATLDAVLGNGSSLQRGLLKGTAPVAKLFVRRDYGVNQAGADEAVEGIRSVMGEIESELDGGDYLVGDSFSVADLSACALITPLLAPPGRPWVPACPPELQPLREELEARPGGAWVAEMYARHRGVPVAA